jgi:mitochondrial fission protein ELM1
MRAVILSDGKQGHLTQSIAVCTLKGWSYEIVEVYYTSKLFKILSYIFDKLSIKAPFLFEGGELPLCDVIVGTGSTTYYPLKVLGKKLSLPTVAVMQPKGYNGSEYTWIIAPEHDQPIATSHMIVLPINPVLAPLVGSSMGGRFSFSIDKRYIGVIIGGPNAIFSLTQEDINPLLEHLFLLDDVEVVVTTSRRTPLEVEEALKKYPFAYRHLYSDDPFNPIPAFLTHCEHVVITSDSTSMISEAVVGGKCGVDVVMLPSNKRGKFHTLIENLETRGCLHIFDGKLGKNWEKIDLKPFLKKLDITQKGHL